MAGPRADLVLVRWLLRLALLFVAADPAAGQRLNFRNYTNVEGLPQRQVFAVYQDSTGYLWLGTYGGVSRYNGAEFRNYSASDGLSSNTVYDLTEDDRGRLAVATRGGGLCLLEGDRFQCLRAGEQLVNDYVRSLARDSDGNLWIATEGGVTHLGAAGSRHYTSAQGLPSDYCWKIVSDRRGNTWVGTNRGLARLRGDRFEPVAADVLGGRQVRMLLPLGEDLLVGTDAGLFVWRGGRLLPFPQETESAGFDFSDAASDGRGTIWIATRSGVLRYDGKALERLTHREGLLTDIVHRVLVDRESNIWFGTEAGVSKLVPGPFLNYTQGDGLIDSLVRALGEDAQGRLWVGTRSGISVLEGDRFWSLTTRNGLENDRIYGFAALPEGGMLIATRNGLALWREGIRRTYHVRDGLPDEYVTSLFVDRRRQVWIGTSRGLARWEKGRITSFPRDPVLSTAYVLTMKDDAKGLLWIGLRFGGVAVFDGVRAIVKGLTAGLTDETIWSIDRDRSGRMWIGSNGYGAFVVDGEKVRRITTREGLINDFVWATLCDSSGRVWLYTNRGLDRYENGRFVHYGLSDGLIDLEGSTNAAMEGSRGDLWFGTVSGVTRFIPSREAPNSVPPRVVLEEAWTGTGPLHPGAEIPFDAGVLTFRFAALSLRAESAVRFRHRLLGVEQGWSAPTAERRISYARLAPGRYEFQVDGSNDRGVWSPQAASFPFAVRPPYWKAWWFQVLWATLLLGVVGGAFAYRVRRLDAERDRLARMVAERTAELEEKNAQLNQLAIIDELTRVHNRRYFIESLDAELRKMSRSPERSSLSLMILDLDHFKRVNDTHGHLVGDQLLAAVALRVQASVRSTDIVARYGGEEFAVIMPFTGLEGATTLAQKVHSAISERPFGIEGLSLRLTASIGLAQASGTPRYGEALSRRLIYEADAALYKSKQEGRDRVTFYEAPEGTST